MCLLLVCCVVYRTCRLWIKSIDLQTSTVTDWTIDRHFFVEMETEEREIGSVLLITECHLACSQVDHKGAPRSLAYLYDMVNNTFSPIFPASVEQQHCVRQMGVEKKAK